MSLKNHIISLAIIILTISVVVYGVNLLYDKPEYSDFCDEGALRIPKSVDEGTLCAGVCVPMYEISEDGICVFDECGSGCGSDGVKTFDTLKQCEIVASGGNCNDLYRSASEKHSRNVFFIALPVGIAIVTGGALFFGLEAVGAGLMGGGVGIIFWGVGGFWRFADDLLKFILSLVGLIVVIWVAYYFNKKFVKKKKE